MAMPGASEHGIVITTVFDNYAVSSRLATRWGFAAVVATPRGIVLFDTGGDSSVLLANMKRMKIAPKSIRAIVISHIHRDHLGGLQGLLAKNPNVTVYIPASFPDAVRRMIRTAGADFRDVTGPTKVMPGIFTTGPLRNGFDEQALVVNTRQGLVVITGCAQPARAGTRRRRQRHARLFEAYFSNFIEGTEFSVKEGGDHRRHGLSHRAGPATAVAKAGATGAAPARSTGRYLRRRDCSHAGSLTRLAAYPIAVFEEMSRYPLVERDGGAPSPAALKTGQRLGLCRLMPINISASAVADTPHAGPGPVRFRADILKEPTMRYLLGKTALVLMLGTPLMLGGCATQEAVEHAQSTADAAMAAAQHAQASADAAAQKADTAAAEAKRANDRLDQLERMQGEKG